MAAVSGSLIHGTAAGSAFITSLKPISDMLQALVTAGVLLQTSDTGQVSWGSVSATNSTVTYYEIFKLNDSLNSTAPLFMKFSYVPNVTTTLTTSLQFSLGTGSDGAGNLTGACAPIIIRGGVASAAAVDTLSKSCWASAGDGYLTLFGGFAGTLSAQSSGGFAFAIERLRNSSGTALADGVTVIAAMEYESTSAATWTMPGPLTFSHPANTCFIANNYSAQRSNFANLFATANNVWPPVANKGGAYYATPQFDGTNFLAVAIQPYAGKLYSPATAVLFCDSVFPTLANPSLSLYSTAHTYYTLNYNLPGLFAGVSQAPNGVAGAALIIMATLPAFRWE